MIVGDAPPEAVVALEVIVAALRRTNCAPLTDTASWSEAIYWAQAQPAYENDLKDTDAVGRDRQRIIGEACLHCADAVMILRSEPTDLFSFSFR